MGEIASLSGRAHTFLREISALTPQRLAITDSNSLTLPDTFQIHEHVVHRVSEPAYLKLANVEE